MARYEKVKIRIENIGKREYTEMLNTIAYRKLSATEEDLIPFENGECVLHLTLLTSRKENIFYGGDILLIAKFLFRTKKMVEDGFNSRWMYIREEEYLEFEREMNINEILNIN